MIFTGNRNISFLASDALEKYSKKVSISLKKENGKEKLTNLLSPKEQNIIYDKMHLDNIHVKSKELFAISTIFTYNDKEYHGVLQKKNNSFKPVKFFEKINDKLEEIKPFDFVNGKNGVYYSPDDINKFITALVFKIQDTNDRYFINFNEQIKEFIVANIKTINNKQQLQVNVDNIQEWANIIQNNNNIDDFGFFKNTITEKIKKMYAYMPEEKIKTIVDNFSDLIMKGMFKDIDADSITKITLSDIPTLQRFIVGQINEDENYEFETRNKMLTSFLSKAKLEIKECSAANYLLSGISNSNIPVFYSSTIFNDNTFTDNFTENSEKALEDLSNFIKSKKGLTATELIDYINSKDLENNLYSHVYLKTLKDNMLRIKSKDESPKRLYPIVEKIVKNISTDSKLLSPVIRAINNNLSEDELFKSYIRVMNNALLVSRASCQNTLSIEATESKDKIYNSKNGQKLPIEIFYSPHEQIANFSKNAGLRKDGENIESFYGLSLTGITEIANKNGKYLPIKMHRFNYKETGFEQIAKIVSNLANANEKGELVFENINDDMIKEEKVYSLDIDKNIKNLDKLINDKFINKNTGELYKTQLSVAESIIGGYKMLAAINNSNLNLSDKIKQMQEVIKNNNTLQKLQEVGDAKKPDFNKILSIRTAVLNNTIINKFVYKNKENLLNDTIYIKKPNYPAFIKDQDEGLSLSNRVATSIVLDLQKNIKTYEYLNTLDNNVEETIEKIKEISSGKSNYDKFKSKSEIEQIEQSKILSTSSFIKALSSLISAKHTQSIPSSINYWVSKVVQNEFYPIEKIEKDEKTGREYVKRTTTSEEIMNLIDSKSRAVEEKLFAIKEEVSNEYKTLLEKKKEIKKPSYGFEFTPERKKEEKIVMNEEKESHLIVDEISMGNEKNENKNEVSIEVEELNEELEEIKLEEKDFGNPLEEKIEETVDVDIQSLDLPFEIEDEVSEEKDSKLNIDFSEEINLLKEVDEYDALEDVGIPTLEELEQKKQDEIEIDNFSSLPTIR